MRAPAPYCSRPFTACWRRKHCRNGCWLTACTRGCSCSCTNSSGRSALRASDARHIFIGVNALDYSGYPDCRPQFIAAFESLAALGTKAGVAGERFQVHTPLIAMTKAQIITRGIELGLDYGLTHSCYDPSP